MKVPEVKSWVNRGWCTNPAPFAVPVPVSSSCFNVTSVPVPGPVPCLAQDGFQLQGSFTIASPIKAFHPPFIIPHEPKPVRAGLGEAVHATSYWMKSLGVERGWALGFLSGRWVRFCFLSGCGNVELPLGSFTDFQLLNLVPSSHFSFLSGC